MISGIIAAVVATATYIFRSKETKQDQRIILRRFLAALFEMMRCRTLAEEFKQLADNDRRLRELKQQNEIAQTQAKVDKAIDLNEQRQAKDEAKRSAALDRAAAKIKQLKDPKELRKAIAKRDVDRDQNTRDAAEINAQHRAAIERAGGVVQFTERSKIEIERFLSLSGLSRPDKTTDEVAQESPEVAVPKRKKVRGKGGSKDKPSE